MELKRKSHAMISVFIVTRDGVFRNSLLTKEENKCFSIYYFLLIWIKNNNNHVLAKYNFLSRIHVRRHIKKEKNDI